MAISKPDILDLGRVRKLGSLQSRGLSSLTCSYTISLIFCAKTLVFNSLTSIGQLSQDKFLFHIVCYEHRKHFICCGRWSTWEIGLGSRARYRRGGEWGGHLAGMLRLLRWRSRCHIGWCRRALSLRMSTEEFDRSRVCGDRRWLSGCLWHLRPILK